MRIWPYLPVSAEPYRPPRAAGLFEDAGISVAAMTHNANANASNRSFLTLLLGSLLTVGALSIDMYLPALPAISLGLNSPIEKVQLSITVFLAGVAAGMLFYGPISDKYGRRWVLLSGLSLYCIATIFCILATNIEQFIVARFFQALGASSASALSRAVVRDLYSELEAIRKLSLMSVINAGGPLIAPIVGSFLLGHWGWRSIFYALLFWGLLNALLVWKYLPETLHHSKQSATGLGNAFAAYLKIFGDLPALGLILANGMSFATAFAYITEGSFYFIELHGFTPTAYAFIFSANAVALIIGNFLNNRLVVQFGPTVMARLGCSLAVAGGTIAWLSSQCGDIVPGFVGGVLIAISMTGLIGANSVGLLTTRYPHNVGAAVAVIGSMQFILGASASALVSYLHDGSSNGVGIVILATTIGSLLGYLAYAAGTGHTPNGKVSPD